MACTRAHPEFASPSPAQQFETHAGKNHPIAKRFRALGHPRTHSCTLTAAMMARQSGGHSGVRQGDTYRENTRSDPGLAG